MKVCPHCYTINNDNAIFCKDCGHSIINVKTGESDNYPMEYIKNKDLVYKMKKRKKIMLLHKILIPIFLVLYIYMYIKCLLKDSLEGTKFYLTLIAILLPLSGYLLIHHPKFLFEIQHSFSLKNAYDVELTEAYLLNSKISGCLTIIGSLILLIIMALNA